MIYFLSALALAGEPDSTAKETNAETSDSTQSAPLEPVTQPEESPQELQPISVELVLQNGMVLRGTVPMNELITWSAGTDITFTPTGGQPSVITGDKIANVKTLSAPTQTQPEKQKEQEGTKYLSPKGYSYINPAASRYLYAPSSISLQKDQWYVSQKLLFTSAVYGLTDNITVVAGTFSVFPPLLSILGTKISIPITEKISASAGTELFIIGLDSTIPLAIGFGALTFGDTDRHLTIASGYLHDDNMAFLDSKSGVPIMVAGHYRFTNRTAVVTENWVLMDVGVNDGESQFVGLLNSLAIRVIGKRDQSRNKSSLAMTSEGYPRLTWDIGLIVLTNNQSFSQYSAVENTEIRSDFRQLSGIGPLPWVDVAWHFGPARKDK